MIWPLFRFLAEIYQKKLCWFFGKFKTSKRHSEINWPLVVFWIFSTSNFCTSRTFETFLGGEIKFNWQCHKYYGFQLKYILHAKEIIFEQCPKWSVPEKQQVYFVMFLTLILFRKEEWVFLQEARLVPQQHWTRWILK